MTLNKLQYIYKGCVSCEWWKWKRFLYNELRNEVLPPPQRNRTKLVKIQKHVFSLLWPVQNCYIFTWNIHSSVVFNRYSAHSHYILFPLDTHLMKIQVLIITEKTEYFFKKRSLNDSIQPYSLFVTSPFMTFTAFYSS